MKSDSKAQEREETCSNLNQPHSQPCGMRSHAQLNQRPSYRILCWHYIPHFEASWFLIYKKFCQFSTDKSLSWLWRPRWKFQWIFNMTPLYTLTNFYLNSLKTLWALVLTDRMTCTYANTTKNLTWTSEFVAQAQKMGNFSVSTVITDFAALHGVN